MIYSADMGVGKVAGITLDQATGEMKTGLRDRGPDQYASSR